MNMHVTDRLKFPTVPQNCCVGNIRQLSKFTRRQPLAVSALRNVLQSETELFTYHFGSVSRILNIAGGFPAYLRLSSRSVATADEINSPLYSQMISPFMIEREANAHLPAARSSWETWTWNNKDQKWLLYLLCQIGKRRPRVYTAIGIVPLSILRSI